MSCERFFLAHYYKNYQFIIRESHNSLHSHPECTTPIHVKYLDSILCFDISVSTMYAELATTIKECGGEPTFLRVGLGKPIGFLHTWSALICRLICVLTLIVNSQLSNSKKNFTWYMRWLDTMVHRTAILLETDRNKPIRFLPICERLLLAVATNNRHFL